MEKKKLLRFEPLRPELAAAFGAMTFPAYRHLLSLEKAPRHAGLQPVTPLAISAWIGDEPAGLALAEIPDDATEGEALSLFVRQGLRGYGVGTELVSALLDALSARGLTAVKGIYMTGEGTPDALERVLAKCGFTPPETRMLSLRIEIEELKKTDWFGKYELDPRMEVFLWSSLTPADRDALRRSQEATGWMKPSLEPWRHDAYGFEPVSSIGLRLDGKIVGWVINHAMSETLVRFTCSFIRRDLGRRGKIVPLFTESIRRLEGTSFRSASFTVPLQHEGMVRFALRRIAPWASFFGETRGTRRELAPRTS